MKTRTTLILFLLTAAFAAWMLLRKEHTNPDGHLLFDFSDRTLALQTPTVDIDGAQVAGIDLQSGTTRISLRRNATGRWELTAPFTDRADEAIVKQLVEYTSLARIESYLKKGELDSGKVSAAGLGFDAASLWRVTWLGPDGSKLTEIHVGKSTPTPETAYVQVPGRDERPDIYLVKPDLRLILARPADTFRDPRVARYTSDEVQRLVVRKGEGEVEFSRDTTNPAAGAPWVISRPLSNAAANQAAVKEFVAMICGAKLEGWLPWTEAPATDKPFVEAILFPAGANATGTTLSFYDDPEGADKFAICRDAQRKAVFKVSRALMEDLCYAESPNNFRDIKLASIDPAYISTLRLEQIEGDSVEVVRVKDKWSWRLISGGPWNDAAPEAVDRLIRLVNETEITGFESDSLADPAAYALDKPAITLTFAKGAHESLEKLTPVGIKNDAGISNAKTLRIGIRNDGRIFANFAGEPFVYRIGPELPGAVPRSALKWRSLLLSTFSLQQLRTLRQTVASAPPLEMTFDPLSFQWKATRAGNDVTAQLLKPETEDIANTLGALSAAIWLGDSADATKAFATPAVRLEAGYLAFTDDPTVNRPETFTIELAPMAAPKAPMCYGRLNGSSDYFLLDSKYLRLFSRNLLGK